MRGLINDYKLAAEAIVRKETAEVITRKVVKDGFGIVATTLKGIVASKGVEIYRDIPELSEQLKAQGIRDSSIKQVELVLYGSSLTRYLDQLSDGLSAVDVNNIILTAERAGLSAKAARKTVSDILYSLNVPQLAHDLSSVELTEQAMGGTIYIPPAAYAGRIGKLQTKVKNGQELTKEEFSELDAFALAGIPVAHTLLGQIYLEGLGVPQDESTALEHLKCAASHGDAEAYGLLADYNYGKDNMKAFQLYSRPGAMALDEERWERFRNLNRVKRHHNIQALLLVALTLFAELFMFVFSSSVITGEHMVACIVCSVINFLIAIGSVMVHIKNPYQDLRNLSLPLLVTFFIFAQILI